MPTSTTKLQRLQACNQETAAATPANLSDFVMGISYGISPGEYGDDHWTCNLSPITKDMQFGFAFCQLFGKSNEKIIMTKPPDGTRLSATSHGRGWLKTAGTGHGDLVCWETSSNWGKSALTLFAWSVGLGLEHIFLSCRHVWQNLRCLKASPSTPSYQSYRRRRGRKFQNRKPIGEGGCC